MNKISKQTLLKIIDESRRYPSPHNSQPIMVKIKDADLEIYYNLDRGLPAESYGAQFGFVCAGVFLASLKIVARHHGFDTQKELKLTDMDFTASNRNHFLGTIHFLPLIPDEASEREYECYLERQTSRIPYDNKLVDDAAIDDASKIAKGYGHTLHVLHDIKMVSKVIDINQRTLFMDLANDAVHRELMEWLRFSRREAQQKADGLSAETMLINGSVLRFMIKHRGLWKLPIIGQLVKYVYLNTMHGVRQIAWLSGPFDTREDFVRAGECFMDVWISLTNYGIRLHPYGTVITNPISHKAFVDLVGQNEESGTMAWMLFRLGYSKTPPQSFRRELSSMLIEE